MLPINNNKPVIYRAKRVVKLKHMSGFSNSFFLGQLGDTTSRYIYSFYYYLLFIFAQESWIFFQLFMWTLYQNLSESWPWFWRHPYHFIPIAINYIRSNLVVHTNTLDSFSKIIPTLPLQSAVLYIYSDFLHTKISYPVETIKIVGYMEKGNKNKAFINIFRTCYV